MWSSRGRPLPCRTPRPWHVWHVEPGRPPRSRPRQSGQRPHARWDDSGSDSVGCSLRETAGAASGSSSWAAGKVTTSGCSGRAGSRFNIRSSHEGFAPSIALAWGARGAVAGAADSATGVGGGSVAAAAFGAVAVATSRATGRTLSGTIMGRLGVRGSGLGAGGSARSGSIAPAGEWAVVSRAPVSGGAVAGDASLACSGPPNVLDRRARRA